MMESSEHSIAAAPRPAPEGPIHPSSGRRRIDWRRIFAPFGAILLFLAKLGAKLKALLLLLPKLKLLTTPARCSCRSPPTRSSGAGRSRVGFVAAAVRARDGPRDPAAARGREGQRADVHPVPRRRRRRALDGRRRARRGPRRPRRARCSAGSARRGAGLSRGRPDSDLLRALAFTGFFLNLFNLLPVVPLDGGRAMAAMAPWMWFAGFAALVGSSFSSPTRSCF